MKYFTTAVILSTTLLNLPSQAQMTPDITLPNNTSLTVEGNTTTINGGTQIGNNLFHSFKDFSVPTGSTVQFANPIGIQNIITRVTGGSLSNIDGLIKANGAANLLFINPNGITFGPNARLSIGGSFFASTADAIKFTDGEFSAINPQAPPLLIVNVPVGLKFGSNRGGIRVNGIEQGLISGGTAPSPSVINSEQVGLQVSSGKTLALVGSDLNVEGGNLTAQEGQIELGSVSSGTVNLNSLDQKPFLDYGNVSSFRDINISKTALVNSSGNTGGLISLHGKNISVSDGSVLLVQNSGSQNWGGIKVYATESLKLNGTSSDRKFFSTLRTESVGTGSGGDINIFTPDLTLEAGAAIGTTSYNSVKGGNINVDSNSIQLINYVELNPYTTTGIIANTAFSGDAGDIKLSTGKLLAQDGGLITSFSIGTGDTGNILINAFNKVELINSEELINLERFYVASYIATQAYTSGKAGNITINTPKAVVGEKAYVNTATYGFGDGGTITINASNVKISGTVNSSALQASADIQRFFRSPSTPSGSSGELNINSETLQLLNGGEIAVKNEGTGDAGTLTVRANLIKLNSGSIAASSASGEGGNIFLGVQNLQLRQSSTINSSAGNSGNGGNITIDGGTVAILEGSSIRANAFLGRGGNIVINGQGVYISPDSVVSATSEQGVDGSVEVNAPNQSLDQTLSEIAVSDAVDVYSCGAPEENYFVIAGTGGIPQSPEDPVRSLSGWHDTRQPASTTQSAEIPAEVEPEQEQQYREAQGIKQNPDGTMSFTDTPSQGDAYGSTSGGPCDRFQNSESEPPQTEQ